MEQTDKEDSSKMKLTIFSNGVSNGGAERVTCNLANYFVENGYDVDLLTMSDDEPTYYIDERVRRIELIKRSERKSFAANLLRRVGNDANRLLYWNNADCMDQPFTAEE